MISIENLLNAWREFVRGKKNKIDVQEFARDLSDNIVQLHEDLVEGRYIHGGYHTFKVHDPKPRRIDKASVRDRVLHHAIYRKLYPFFHQAFISDSYSCQQKKGSHRALNRFRSFEWKVSRNNTKTCWILKCDIKKFFASIDHKLLLSIIASYISDKRIHRLLQKVIESFSLLPGKGVPLGNLTSQLFCNVYLNEFDNFVKHGLKIKFYIRYADDFVLLSRSRKELSSAISKIQDYVERHLKLSLHPKKVSIESMGSGVDFLGWIHFPTHRVLRGTTRRRIVRRMRESPETATLQSYLGLLSHGNTKKIKEQLLNNYWVNRNNP